MTIPREIDWARLAAYLDGEGCISIAKKKITETTSRTYLTVVIANNDARLMTWLTDHFGGSVCNVKPPADKVGKWGIQYRWTVANQKAKEVMEACLPYFVMKREQAEIGIAHQNLIHSGLRFSDSRREERESMRRKISELKGTASRGRGIRMAVVSREEAIA